VWTSFKNTKKERKWGHIYIVEYYSTIKSDRACDLQQHKWNWRYNIKWKKQAQTGTFLQVKCKAALR
jgi:hypothetical protein